MSALQEELYYPINPLSSKHLKNCVDLQGSFESPYDDFKCETLVQYIFEDKFEEASTPRQKSQPSSQQIINSLLQTDDSLFESEDEPKSWWNSSELPTLVVCNDKNLTLIGEVPVLDIADEELDEQINTIEEEIARIEEQKIIIRAATSQLLMEETTLVPSTSDSQLQSVLQDFFGANEASQDRSVTSDSHAGSNDSAHGSSLEDEDVEIEVEDPLESVILQASLSGSESTSTPSVTSPISSPIQQNSETPNGRPGRLKRSASTSNSVSKSKPKRRKTSVKDDQPVIKINIELELLDLESSPLPSKLRRKNSQNCSFNSSKKKRTKLSPSKKKLLAEVFKEEKILKLKSEGIDQDQDEDVDIGNLSDCTNY